MARCFGFRRRPKAAGSLKAVHGFPPLPEGAGFRPCRCARFRRHPRTPVSAGTARELPSLPEGMVIRLRWLLRFPPLSEDIGVSRCGLLRLPPFPRDRFPPSRRMFQLPCPKARVPFHAGCARLRRRPKASVSPCAAGGSACIRGCWFLRPRLLLLDDVAAEASASFYLKAEASGSGGSCGILGFGRSRRPRFFRSPRRGAMIGICGRGPRSAIYPTEAG